MGSKLSRYPFGELLDQADNLARVGVAPGLELGEDHLVVHANLEPASTGRNKRDILDLGFEICE